MSWVSQSEAKSFPPLAELDQAAIPIWTSALTDPHGTVRERAARALGAMGSRAAEASPHLASRLEDDQTYVVRAAAEALLEVAPEASEWRERACAMLEQLGIESKPR